MIDGLKPYQEYKESGVPWLGEIPKHWEVQRFKYLLREINTRSLDGQEQLLRVSQYTGVTPRLSRNGDNEPDTRAESLVGYKHVKSNDLVVNIMLAWNGSLGISRSAGIVSPAYCVYRFNDHAEPWYYHNLLRLPLYKGRIKVDSRGVIESRLRLYSDELFRIEALLPKKEEQAAIMRFVEVLSRRFDHLIRTKQRRTELLNEQKQGIIHRAVTRGLDPDVKLKPTGNSWFFDCPSHWDVLPLRRLIHKAVDGPHHSPTYVDSGIPFISARNVKTDRWSLADAKFISKKDYDEFSKRVIPEPGDLLYTKGGTTGIARAVDLDFPFQVWVHIAVLKLKRTVVDPDFLALALNSPRCYEQSQLYTRGATNQDLGLNRMKGIILPVPPTIKEQQTITTKLIEELHDLNPIIDRTRREIDLLLEYRTRLISDVVTGKLDVRGVELPAMDEAESMGDIDIGEDTEMEAIIESEEVANAY